MSHILFAWGPLFEDTYVGRVLVHLPHWDLMRSQSGHFPIG